MEKWLVTGRAGLIGSSFIRHALAKHPDIHIASGIREKVQWYLNHQSCVNAVMTEDHDNWIEVNYRERTSVS